MRTTRSALSVQLTTTPRAMVSATKRLASAASTNSMPTSRPIPLMAETADSANCSNL